MSTPPDATRTPADPTDADIMDARKRIHTHPEEARRLHCRLVQGDVPGHSHACNVEAVRLARAVATARSSATQTSGEGDTCPCTCSERGCPMVCTRPIHETARDCLCSYHLRRVPNAPAGPDLQSLCERAARLLGRWNAHGPTNALVLDTNEWLEEEAKVRQK